MKLYIISNRLPAKACKEKNGTFIFSRSEGGLATGLNSLKTTDEKHWIGWPGICVDKKEDEQIISEQLEKLNFHPVFLSCDQYKNYYEGYSNSTIWPLCHYFFAYTEYKNCFWKAYQEVNALFCEKICSIVSADDYVWIQDYQLMLLPGMLRKRMPHLRIGYFHHIPFPSYELFRILPERGEILQGLLGADFIAFHTHDYMRHFISAAERVLNIDFQLDEIQIGNRVIRVEALPMGINYDLYHSVSENPEVQKAINRFQNLFGNHKMILSVDRLDYSKGILHRLWGFSLFLEHHPEYLDKVTLAMVIVPSRDQVNQYAELKTKIDEEIGAINGKYSTIDWTPVCYFYHGFSFEELAAMYFVADIALVTPLRDGMNLVAKEYVATKQNNPGVLILSEMAGCAVELTDAIQINPNDIEEIEQAIVKALEMPEREQKNRINHMQAILSNQTINKWAADFMTEWNDICSKNQRFRLKRIVGPVISDIRSRYKHAHKRLILLDYDGTLTAIRNRPEDAKPDPELIELLQQLAEDKKNHIVINSGRDHLTLEKWLGQLPISFAAEHGAFYKENGKWNKNIQSTEWSPSLLSTLKLFVSNPPRSHLEVKDTALAFHYRQTDSWLGALRAQQLTNSLIKICLQQKLQILQGDKVVEIKSPHCNKGSEVNRLLQKDHYDFILAIGDDVTDDDMFQALPSTSVTVKIGTASKNARYNLTAQSEVIPFLQALIHRDLFQQKNLDRKENIFSIMNFFKKLLPNNK